MTAAVRSARRTGFRLSRRPARATPLRRTARGRPAARARTGGPHPRTGSSPVRVRRAGRGPVRRLPARPLRRHSPPRASRMPWRSPPRRAGRSWSCRCRAAPTTRPTTAGRIRSAPATICPARADAAGRRPRRGTLAAAGRRAVPGPRAAPPPPPQTSPAPCPYPSSQATPRPPPSDGVVQGRMAPPTAPSDGAVDSAFETSRTICRSEVVSSKTSGFHCWPTSAVCR